MKWMSRLYGVVSLCIPAAFPILILVVGYCNITVVFKWRRVLLIYGLLQFYSHFGLWIFPFFSDHEVSSKMLTRLNYPLVSDVYMLLSNWIGLSLLSPMVNGGLQSFTNYERGWVMVVVFIWVAASNTAKESFRAVGGAALGHNLILYIGGGIIRLVTIKVRRIVALVILYAAYRFQKFCVFSFRGSRMQKFVGPFAIVFQNEEGNQAKPSIVALGLAILKNFDLIQIPEPIIPPLLWISTCVIGAYGLRYHPLLFDFFNALNFGERAATREGLMVFFAMLCVCLGLLVEIYRRFLFSVIFKMFMICWGIERLAKEWWETKTVISDDGGIAGLNAMHKEDDSEDYDQILGLVDDDVFERIDLEHKMK
jgi:hypothetical protein